MQTCCDCNCIKTSDAFYPSHFKRKKNQCVECFKLARKKYHKKYSKSAHEVHSDSLVQETKEIIICCNCKEKKQPQEICTGKKKRKNLCRKCATAIESERRSSEKGIFKDIVCNAKSAAKRRFNRGRTKCGQVEVDEDFVKKLWHDQCGLCAVCNIKLEWSSGPWRVSLDRIDSDLGYLKSNVRLVCWIVNNGMSNFGDESFETMCEEVSKMKRIRLAEGLHVK